MLTTTMDGMWKWTQEKIERTVPDHVRGTWMLRGFALTKVPMMAFAGPVVDELSDVACGVRIPLSWRTKNHYNSMYFGALAIGADCAGGLLAMHHADKAMASANAKQGVRKVRPLFKDVHAEFLKRADGDVLFRCNDGLMLQQAVLETMSTGARINKRVTVEATVPSVSKTDVVALFHLTISLK